MEKKWITVTGGTKGIGFSILEAFMQEGFNAITCARNEVELENLKVSFGQRFPNQQLQTFVADLSKKSDCQHFGDFVKNKTARLDVLVNNTGYFTPGQIHQEEEGVLEKMMETNLYSAYHTTRTLLPLMLSQKSGHVFNICSIASIMPYANGGSYSISKYALLGMTKVLREEMKPQGIRVTAVLPGATHTSSWEGVNLPEERFMKTSDVAKAVLSCWKLSDCTVVEEIILRPQLGDI
ncbi:MAG TPA: short-chain dehydrogenase [Cytophagales bacterium]|nr:short-chain dehydrogenase [Cytophagales bacterium]